MKKVVSIVVVVVIVAIGMYFLAHNKSNASSSNNTGSSSQATNKQNGSQQASNQVTIKDMAFSPANLTVKKGTTVTWTNQDGVAHNVTETDGQNGPKSGNLEQGKSYTFTFNTAGTFKYNCTIHPYMKGTITVTE